MLFNLDSKQTYIIGSALYRDVRIILEAHDTDTIELEGVLYEAYLGDVFSSMSQTKDRKRLTVYLSRSGYHIVCTN